MRERTTWSRQKIASQLRKVAEDPYSMEKEHMDAQPDHDEYQLGDGTPSQFGEDVNSGKGSWKADKDSEGNTKRNELGMPEFRSDTFNSPDRSPGVSPSRQASLSTAEVQVRAQLATRAARFMLPKKASEQAIEDQALLLMDMPTSSLRSTLTRLAQDQDQDDDDEDDDDDDKPQSKQAQQDEDDEDDDKPQSKQAQQDDEDDDDDDKPQSKQGKKRSGLPPEFLEQQKKMKDKAKDKDGDKDGDDKDDKKGGKKARSSKFAEDEEEEKKDDKKLNDKEAGARRAQQQDADEDDDEGQSKKAQSRSAQQDDDDDDDTQGKEATADQDDDEKDKPFGKDATATIRHAAIGLLAVPPASRQAAYRAMLPMLVKTAAQGLEQRPQLAQKQQLSQQQLQSQVQQLVQEAMQQQQQQQQQQQLAQDHQQLPQLVQDQDDSQALVDQLFQEPGQGQQDFESEEFIQMDSPSMDINDVTFGPEDAALNAIFAAEPEVQRAMHANAIQNGTAPKTRTASTRTVGTRPTVGVSHLGGASSTPSGGSEEINRLSGMWSSAPDVSGVFRS